ncbi:GIY-YIG nuclease family protein [Clostridium botulinum]|uniref:GIY-YIG nuclease family protein n=1 Tax=Clostridium botulinum TaxID=1491 RepID=UPI001C9A3F80|nr:GIY-YIG nuclease family protein [Clostridium botulinum]MBY6816452.1 GIY-YIG nuclease family protein [Clostridium botulinum]MBY6827293.1 GIY-YIG nuclease family protein [Clostridium botulinum]MBY6859241.1 GIY-YIG nuclease family protein [Clostridium botulinum]MBY7041475.1 GIY-YIG nuclease family protein [Clostridium botulinum]
MGYIYGIFIGDKCLYVGQTKRNPNERFKEHKRDIKNKKHKIKSLNTYNVDNLEFRVLFGLDTDNTLLLSIAECCYNSIYKPKNRCILQQGRNKVILQRCNKDIAEKLLDCIYDN